MNKLTFVVTGGRGFIGSHFVERALAEGHKVINIDSLTYAANDCQEFFKYKEYEEIEDDIVELKSIPQCDYLMNFAAETHVDNSLEAPDVFMRSNFMGVFNLLKLLSGKVYERPVYFQVSSDEVYGDVRSKYISFSESNILRPSNPYSASKAAAEMLVYAYYKTYGIEYIITRSSNNYGPRQYHEKLIPQCIKCLKEGRKIPIHGDGSYVRDWIYVKDNVDAMFKIIHHGRAAINNIYNISAQNSMSNLEVVRSVCEWFGQHNYMDHVKMVTNRMGQDERYAISNDKIKSLGWTPKHECLYNFLGECND